MNDYCLLSEITDAEAAAYGFNDLDFPAYEAEFNDWLAGLEEAATYRELVAAYTPRRS